MSWLQAWGTEISTSGELDFDYPYPLDAAAEPFGVRFTMKEVDLASGGLTAVGDVVVAVMVAGLEDISGGEESVEGSLGKGSIDITRDRSSGRVGGGGGPLNADTARAVTLAEQAVDPALARDV